MKLDLRIPLGTLFTLFGMVLTGYGLLNPDLRASLTAGNVNLYSGLAMLLFGASMLLLAWRAKSADKTGPRR